MLAGRIANDIKLETTSGGRHYLRTAVACKRNYKDKKTGNYESDFVPVILWDNSADFVATLCQKGDLVEMTGTWNVVKKQDQAGITHTYHECIVTEVSLLARSSSSPQPKQENPKPHDQTLGESPKNFRGRNEPDLSNFDDLGGDIDDDDLPF